MSDKIHGLTNDDEMRAIVAGEYDPALAAELRALAKIPCGAG